MSQPNVSTLTSAPVAPVTPLPAYPTVCPSWCRERHVGDGQEWAAHWSPEYRLSNPQSATTGDDAVLRMELFRLDEGHGTGATRMYVVGESSVEMGRDEAEIFVAQLDATLTAARILLRQMG